MRRSAREIAEYVAAKLEGDAECSIAGVAGPETAGGEDLIFVDEPRALERARHSAARCVLLRPEMRLPGKTQLRVANPKLAFARAAQWLLQPASVACGIHATAVIAPSARLAAGVAVGPFVVVEEAVEIGAGSQVGAFCFLGRAARLGKDCQLYPRVTLYPGARLGDRVVVHSGVVIGSDGFGYVPGDGRQWKFPQVGGVEVGDDVEIGSNTTIDRGSLGATRIEEGAKLDNLVQVAHNVRIGAHTVVAAQTGISGSSAVGRNVALGGQVGIGDHCTVEDGAVVGGQAGILPGKTIRAGQPVWGTPARPLNRFKEQFAWLTRLPALAERLRRLEHRKAVD